MIAQVRRWGRPAAVVVIIVAVLGLVLTSCPANRDGMPGRLAAAEQEASSAARSGAAAIDLWAQRRSTRPLTAVALSDARDEVVKALEGIATLRAEDPVDLARQRHLMAGLTEIVDLLNTAHAGVRALQGQPDPAVTGRQLFAAAEALDRGYR